MWANYSAQLGLCWKGQDQSGVHVASAAPGRSANPWLVLPGYSMMSEKKNRKENHIKLVPQRGISAFHGRVPEESGSRLEVGG